MLKQHFIYVRILLLMKDILFVCITLRITLHRILLPCIVYACIYCICESNSVELQINLFIIIIIYFRFVGTVWSVWRSELVAVVVVVENRYILGPLCVVWGSGRIHEHFRGRGK